MASLKVAATLVVVALLFGPTVTSAQETPSTPLPVQSAPSSLAYRPLASPAWQCAENGVAAYTDLDDQTFPVSWRSEKIAAFATPVAPAEAERALKVVQNALRKYPASLVRANLERVYVVGELRFQGIRAAGTNSATRIYLMAEANNPLFTNAFLEESFHHEFAHMLRRNFASFWDEAAWSACCAPDFRYGASSGVEAVRVGKIGLRLSETWNKQGFVSEYGATDPMEDFAVVGGALFTGDPALWPTAEKYPLLLAKLRAAIRFYSRIDPSLNEAYFRSLKVGVAPETVVSPMPTPASAASPAPQTSANQVVLNRG